jgi:hypothetical protein
MGQCGPSTKHRIRPTLVVVMLAEAVVVVDTVVVWGIREISRKDEQYDVTRSSFLTSATTSATILQMS